MSESKAAEDYKQFESLRNRFSDTNGSSSPSRPEPRKSSKRRFDPRANAPPLVPLVEEGDQPQHASSPGCVKGKWKHSNQIKCNHLNGPDFDVLETSSTASLSSAYSEPGTFSPPLGSSLSELSDAGSCETFSEYDIKRSKQCKIASLKASFESGSSSPSRNNKPAQYPPDTDVPQNFVNNSKHAWNKVIGDWVFPGISQTQNSQSKPKMRGPSSEVRVPTPLSTPLGSTDNLLMDCGSRSSILSNNDSTASDDYSNFDRRPFLGRMLNKPPSRPSSASCAQTESRKNLLLLMEEVEERSSSETNLILQTSKREENEEEKDEISKTAAVVCGGDDDKTKEEQEQLPQPPKSYKLGKFLSISDTMLPVEERSHEYIAEGPSEPQVEPAKQVKPVEPVEPAETPPSDDPGNPEKKPSEEEMPKYQPGKFVSQVTPLTEPEKTISPEKTKTSPLNQTTNTTKVANLEEGEPVPEIKVPIPKATTSKVPPSNRWFDAYMKCKASQRRPSLPTKSSHKENPPVTKTQPSVKDSATVVNPDQSALEKDKDSDQNTSEKDADQSTAKKDDFEKVQKITPSKSYKWLEAMQKYKAFKEQREDSRNSVETSEEGNKDESPSPLSSTVKSPQKSAEEPTFSSLAQRAQVFGGMRKKPPLRRAKSFQIGCSCDSASPLATGLTRPTRVLKRQQTASLS